MMIKVSIGPNHKFYMQTNQIMQNPNKKREKRGILNGGEEGGGEEEGKKREASYGQVKLDKAG